MTTVLASILGASLAVVFVGYLAISIGKIPLLVITALSLGLMVVAIYQDIRESRNAR